MYVLSLLLLVVMLAACSDRSDVEVNEEVESKHEKAIISVKRTGETVDESVEVFVDDKKVMTVKSGESEVELSLLPGTYTIQAKVQEEKSDMLGFGRIKTRTTSMD